jgi:anaerobic magnesium-protoporphyrin IX monomethyl ester cyclase
MKQLFLFVRPPRPLWPFNGPSSAFWPPLAFASLAAMLRQEIRDLRVEILDAPALQIGWRTLEREIRLRAPDYVGIGEEAVSCVEGLRLAAMAKDNRAQVIAGGCFFGHVAPEALQTSLIDVVVHGEGERTVVELIEALRSGTEPDLSRVAGISYRSGEAVIRTPPRQPMPDLDCLPFPAYDLLPVERYGAASRNHHHLAAIELGRGCIGSCDFCVLWRQMGRLVGDQVVPCLRTKSPARLLEEIRVLVQNYDRHYLGWVDPCFNAHPTVPGEVAELMLREGLIVGQSAWARADGIVRDAAAGALASCVRAGLNELYLGIERPNQAGLWALGKTLDLDQARAAMRILQRDYPEVCAIGSFIYGLPEDTPATIRAIHRLAVELGLDQFFFIPLTPLPGTTRWRPELWDPTGQRFRRFGFLPAYSGGGVQAKLERALVRSILFDWYPARLRGYCRRLFAANSRKRRINWHLVWRAVHFHLARILRRWRVGQEAGGLILPAWYDR